MFSSVGYNTSSQRFHQTEKPLELMQQIVRITSPGRTVFDPFMRSGITLLAAAMEGYDSVGIELSSQYFDTTERRLFGSKERGE